MIGLRRKALAPQQHRRCLRPESRTAAGSLLMLGNFTCARYRFVLQAQTPLRLRAFAGATLRGGFGHVFKRTVCIWPPGDCPRCLLKNTCSYPYVFETAPPPGSAKLRGLEQIPRPFVIEAPDVNRGLYQPGEDFEFRLVLIGRAIDYLPYFLFVFCELGRVGLGPGRGQFQLVEVHREEQDGSQRVYNAADGVLSTAGGPVTAADLTGRLVAAPAGRIVVRFLTPTRIRSDGAVRTQVSFQDLVRALLRRLSSLCYFHCGCELQADFRGLIEQASRFGTVQSDLSWRSQERFSVQQEQRIEMGGVVGQVVFEAPDGEDLTAFLLLLAAGEWVHVGKGCVMGLGKYRINGDR